MRTVDRHAAIVETTPRTLRWRDETATQDFAQQWARNPAITSAFIALHGDLGAGKTTFVRHLLHALGVQGRIKSPTYAVVESYSLPERSPPLDIWHFDFYRFNDPQEWEDAGFRDIFASDGLKLAEWPRQAGELLPLADVDLHLQACGETERAVVLHPNTALGLQLLADLPTEAQGLPP